MNEILGLRTICYKVKDLDEAKSWYTRVFQTAPYFDEPFYVGFNIGGFEFGLDPDLTDTTFGSNQVAYWGVADCRLSFAEMIAAGIKGLKEPTEVGGGIWVAILEDPSGNQVGLIENPHFKLTSSP